MVLSFVLTLVLVVGGVFAYFFWRNKQQQAEFDDFAKEFNLKVTELKKFNGVENKRIFIGVKGDLFDVTTSAFYKPGGSYHIFAGHEASVCLAKGDLEGKYLDQLDAQYTPDEQATLDDWHFRFSDKYRKVGKIVR